MARCKPHRWTPFGLDQEQCHCGKVRWQEGKSPTARKKRAVRDRRIARLAKARATLKALRDANNEGDLTCRD